MCSILQQLQSDDIYPRPEIDVYVRTFDGFALTADTWERQRQILLDDLIGKKVTKFVVMTLHDIFSNSKTDHSDLSLQ